MPPRAAIDCSSENHKDHFDAESRITDEDIFSGKEEQTKARQQMNSKHQAHRKQSYNVTQRKKKKTHNCKQVIALATWANRAHN